MKYYLESVWYTQLIISAHVCSMSRERKNLGNAVQFGSVMYALITDAKNLFACCLIKY